MSSFTMGRYVPYNSFVHRMDPRAKIFCLIALMVAIFLDYSYSWAMTFTMDGIAFVVVLILLWCTHTGFTQVLNSLKSLWIMAIFLLIIYILMPVGTETSWVAFSLGTYPIYWSSILNAIKILLRLMLMIELTMVLTSSTKPLDMTYAFEWYLWPLKWIGFPSHEVAMTLSIALRFIPTILEDVDRIMKAQSSRGVDFKHGHIGAKFHAIISLIVPLFVSSFLRSEELANAMECRGYDPKAKRTRYRKLKFSWWDLLETVFVAGFLALFIYVAVVKFNGYTTWFNLTGNFVGQ
jgi:energy-coupling factor transport system permease protein